jgi:hypothetical protein
MFKRTLLAFGLLLATLSGASAQNTTCSNRPAGDDSNACANTRFVNGAVADAVFDSLGWFIVGSADYPTAQSAVDAAAAQNGGVVYFPCGPDVALGAGAIGLDLRGTKNIRLIGAQGVNSGATSCQAIRYTGTGTMIDASGTIGLEIENLFIVGLSASKCIAFDQHATLAVYASIKRNTIRCNTSATGIGIQLSYLIIATIAENSITSYIGVRGDAEIPGEVANVINFYGNTYHTGSTYHVVNPLGIWNFNGDTFEGGVSGTSIFTTPGSVGTCFALNLRGNDFDDPIAVGPVNARVYTECLQVNSKDNVYSASAGQTMLEAPAGLGARINSDSDYYNLNGTAVDINTGNCGKITDYRAPSAAFVLLGTPNGCGIFDFNYNYMVFGAGIRVGVNTVIGGSIAVAGATSGAANIISQAAAGSPNLTLPTTTGTFAVSATTPITLNAATGVLTVSDAAIAFAKFQDLAALSVFGRSVNSAGVGGNITCGAGSNGVIRESGSTIGCGAIAAAAIPSAAITYAKIQNLGALSVMGRSANSAGVGADISATAASDTVLRESGSTLGFGTLTATATPQMATMRVRTTGINFNAANNDNAITLPLPSGYTRYAIERIYVGNVSASITTATAGMFSAAGGGGTTLVTTAAMTVSTAAANVANNNQILTGTNAWAFGVASNFTSVFFRTVTPQGSAATGDVTVVYTPIQ